MKLFNFIPSISTNAKNLDFKQIRQSSVLESEKEKLSFKDLLTEITSQNLDSLEKNQRENEISKKEPEFKNSFVKENSYKNSENIQEKKNPTKEAEEKKEKPQEKDKNYLPIESSKLLEKSAEDFLKEKSENFQALNKRTSFRDNPHSVVVMERKNLDQNKLDLNFLKTNLKSSEISLKNLETLPRDFKIRNLDFLNHVSLKKEFSNNQKNQIFNNLEEGSQKIHILFSAQSTKDLALKKGLVNKKHSLSTSDEEKRSPQTKNTKEIIQEFLKENLSRKKEDPVSLNQLNPLEKEIPQANGNVNLAFKRGKFFGEDPKKEIEPKIQKENPFKNFIEQNFSNSKILEPKANSFKELFNSTIREALEELIQKAKIHIGKDQFNAQIRLNPSIFGFMSLDMKLENQNLIIKILVDNQDVYKKLQENLDALKNEFAKQGIQIEQLQVKLKETSFFGNQEHFSFTSQFSNSESYQKNFYTENQNSYDTLTSADHIQRNHREELEKAKDTDATYNWNDSKINVWG
ncbi:MAG: flagellar hook-length control protein FliK [Leptonema sp. (in: bacteria)]